MADLASCLKDWDDLDKEFLLYEERHKTYCQKVEDLKAIQRKCITDIKHQKYQLKALCDSLRDVLPTNDADAKSLEDLESKMCKRKEQFRELEEVLPRENTLYLKIVLGSVNMSLMSKQDRYKYKQDYELFKLYVTIVTFVFGLFLWFFLNYRVTDAVYQFLLVWYYCTLTIREHILRMNGSRIKGWWITHHFISTACAGLLLIWPDGYAYHLFRPQFLVFSIYLSCVQVMQYYYQSGALYRLRALGERRNMDLTVEGFQSWMWKGVSFLFPFLIFGYAFQLYNAFTLWQLSFHEQCSEWQVSALSVIFFVLFTGNIWTASLVLRQKIKEKLGSSDVVTRWLNKYRPNSLSTINNNGSGDKKED